MTGLFRKVKGEHRLARMARLQMWASGGANVLVEGRDCVQWPLGRSLSVQRRPRSPASIEQTATIRGTDDVAYVTGVAMGWCEVLDC